MDYIHATLHNLVYRSIMGAIKNKEFVTHFTYLLSCYFKGLYNRYIIGTIKGAKISLKPIKQYENKGPPKL